MDWILDLDYVSQLPSLLLCLLFWWRFEYSSKIHETTVRCPIKDVWIIKNRTSALPILHARNILARATSLLRGVLIFLLHFIPFTHGDNLCLFHQSHVRVSLVQLANWGYTCLYLLSATNRSRWSPHPDSTLLGKNRVFVSLIDFGLVVRFGTVSNVTYLMGRRAFLCEVLILG